MYLALRAFIVHQAESVYGESINDVEIVMDNARLVSGTSGESSALSSENRRRRYSEDRWKADKEEDACFCLMPKPPVRQVSVEVKDILSAGRNRSRPSGSKRVVHPESALSPIRDQQRETAATTSQHVPFVYKDSSSTCEIGDHHHQGLSVDPVLAFAISPSLCQPIISDRPHLYQQSQFSKNTEDASESCSSSSVSLICA